MLLGKRKGRVIDTLRKMLPEYSWRYDRERDHWQPVGQPWYVYTCAAYCPSVDGAEIFQTQYRRSDTSEILFFGRIHYD